MIALRFRRPDGSGCGLIVPADDDATLDKVLAIAFRHFGTPGTVVPPLPKPRNDRGGK